jgi:hypothetical protein
VVGPDDVFKYVAVGRVARLGASIFRIRAREERALGLPKVLQRWHESNALFVCFHL